jgi:WD40 repeat protein
MPYGAADCCGRECSYRKGDDKTAKIWDARTGAELLTLKGHIHGVRSASFSDDGTRVVTGSGDWTARVWDAKTGAELLTLEGHTDAVTSVSFNADGTRVVTGGDDKTARVWDAKSGAEVLTLKGHTDAVTSASFSANGTRIVTGGDVTARVWGVRTGVAWLADVLPQLPVAPMPRAK